MAQSKKQQAAIAMSMKAAGKKPKMQKGGSFPDLNKDGKVTKADILKGRGVYKAGGMAKPMMKTGGYSNPNKAAVVSPKMKMGGSSKMKKK